LNKKNLLEKAAYDPEKEFRNPPITSTSTKVFPALNYGTIYTGENKPVTET
jgi:hypothetical protein